MSSQGQGIDEAVLDDIIRRLTEVRLARPGKQVQLSESEIKQLCVASRDIFINQPNLLELEAPIKICGTLSFLFSLSNLLPFSVQGLEMLLGVMVDSKEMQVTHLVFRAWDFFFIISVVQRHPCLMYYVGCLGFNTSSSFSRGSDWLCNLKGSLVFNQAQ